MTESVADRSSRVVTAFDRRYRNRLDRNRELENIPQLPFFLHLFNELQDRTTLLKSRPTIAGVPSRVSEPVERTQLEFLHRRGRQPSDIGGFLGRHCDARQSALQL